jgi:TPR repeat protein
VRPGSRPRVALALLAGLGAAEAGTAEGLAALKEKDYRKAREEFSAAAEAGDAVAQFHLGDLYLRGRGVEKSPRLATQWYEKAIAHGNGDAQGRLGILLWHGTGIGRNQKRALELLRAGAAGGSAIAQYGLALLDYKGEKVGLARGECYELFRKAGEQGHADAQAKVGDALLHGRTGGKENPEAAEEWLRKAAAQGHVEAMRDLGRCVTKVRGRGEGVEWYRKAALCGDSDSQMAMCSNLLASPEKSEAYAWYVVVSDLANSRPQVFEPHERLRRKQAARAKEMVPKLAERLDAKEVRAGKALARQYIETIRAAMKEERPDWDAGDG